MNNIEKTYLPIGTVCILQNATKKIMITGFCPVDNGKLYDYIGCLHPEGILSKESHLLFNHDQIKQVFYLGYSDEEEKKFKEEIKGLIKETVDTLNSLEQGGTGETDDVY